MSNSIQGPSGGNRSAESFTDDPPPSSRVTAVNVWSGDRVDAVQMVLATGPMEKHGGDGGLLNTLTLEKDEHITRIEGRYGEKLDYLKIYTNHPEKYLEAGGSGGDADYLYESTEKANIVGFHGRSKKEIIAIGVVLQESV